MSSLVRIARWVLLVVGWVMIFECVIGVALFLLGTILIGEFWWSLLFNVLVAGAAGVFFVALGKAVQGMEEDIADFLRGDNE